MFYRMRSMLPYSLEHSSASCGACFLTLKSIALHHAEHASITYGVVL